MPLLVEIMPPEGIDVGIGLIVIFTIDTFETMRVRFSLLSLESWWIHFEIYFAALSKMPIMFNFMRTIAFDVL